MIGNATQVPQAPRWINTEDGKWAWRERETWRHSAARAMSVEDRRNLLHQAELLRLEQEHHA